MHIISMPSSSLVLLLINGAEFILPLMTRIFASVPLFLFLSMVLNSPLTCKSFSKARNLILLWWSTGFFVDQINKMADCRLYRLEGKQGKFLLFVSSNVCIIK